MRSTRVAVFSVFGPGSRLRDDSPTTNWPLIAVKMGTRLTSTCGPPTSSHGSHTL